MNDGTWIDPKTGLEWQVEPAPETMIWTKAREYARSLDLEGDGWRLPAREELVAVSPNSNLEGSGWFWSSSPVEDDDFYAWNVRFSSGGVYTAGVGYGVHVRCVRGGCKED